MVIESLCEGYKIRPLDEGDIPAVFGLYRANGLYFSHCPPPPSHESVREDIFGLPPGVAAENKHYLGFFDGPALVAVMDLLEGYPEEHTVWIGLFMVALSFQGRGTGSAIIGSVCENLRKQGVNRVSLGYVKTNPQAAAFWRKNGFTPTNRESAREQYTIVVASKEL